MRKLTPLKISEKEKENLEKKLAGYELSNEVTNKRKEQICKTILLCVNEKSIEEIIEETGLSRTSIFNYIKEFKRSRYAIFRDKKITNVSELDYYESQIEIAFEKSKIKTCAEAKRLIESTTGISISHTRIKNYLNTHGYKPNASGYIRQNKNKKLAKEIQRRYQTFKNSTYLYQHADEIDMYMQRHGLYDKSFNHIYDTIKSAFPLITETKEQFQIFLEDQTSIKFNIKYY